MLDDLAAAMRIDSPFDLGEQGRLDFVGRTQINWPISARYAFDFHWLHEAASSILEGEFGLKIDAAVDATLYFALNDYLRIVVSLDGERRLRVQLFKSSQKETGFVSKIGVGAQAAVPLPDKPDRLLAALLGVPEAHSLLERGLESFAAFHNLPEEIRRPLAQLFGAIRSEADFAAIRDQLRAVTGLRDAIYGKALTALEKKYSAELSYRYQSSAADATLIDCSFAFTEEGLAAYRKVLQGDFSCVFKADDSHICLRQGLLSNGLQRESLLELHLPFLKRKQWKNRLESFATLKVEATEDGRVLVYDVNAEDLVESTNSCQSALALAGAIRVGRLQSGSEFTLTYSDKRRLARTQAITSLAPALAAYGFDPSVANWLSGFQADPAPGELDACLTLKIPGNLVTAWLETPGEGSNGFYRCFSKVSVAVQRAMRNWLPYVYFSNLSRYDDLGAAFPLLAYQASRPFPGKANSEFTYDVMNPERLNIAYRTAERALPDVLLSVQNLLLATGKTRMAPFYSPRQAWRIVAHVERDVHPFRSLLVADTFFIDELIKLAGRGRELHKDLRRSPQTATRDLSKFTGRFVKAFHVKLRRLYGGEQFLAFGSLLLVEATSALSAAIGARAPVEAILRIRFPGDSMEHVFVNSAAADSKSSQLG